MARINIDGAQNVEVSIKIPCEKTPLEQLEIMEAYTKAHQESKDEDKAVRELNCLKTIFPRLFRSIEENEARFLSGILIVFLSAYLCALYKT